MPVLAAVQLFADPVFRDGPGQMALDEAMLETARVPVLRAYRWAGEWVSFGYSQSQAAVALSRPGKRLVRRWTGGGIVDHDGDWTFSLVVPRQDAFAAIRPADSYCAVHRGVMAALEQVGVGTRLAPQGEIAAPGACFVGQPAEHDVLNRDGAKICGGAQRRTRAGFLHQGSVKIALIPQDFLERLGGQLAAAVTFYQPDPLLESRTVELATSRYNSPSWTIRIT